MSENIKGMNDDTDANMKMDRTYSPCTDRSPSPVPQAGKNNEIKYQYYRLSFANRDLPILLVSYFDPQVSYKMRICCYGGSEKGQRIFLSGSRYHFLLQNFLNFKVNSLERNMIV